MFMFSVMKNIRFTDNWAEMGKKFVLFFTVGKYTEIRWSFALQRSLCTLQSDVSGGSLLILQSDARMGSL